jgi:hypothetical protein
LVSPAGCLFASGRDALHCEHRDGGQDAEDHDDDQQFDEGESLVLLLLLNFDVVFHDERSSRF